jgi:hypothetical protein
VDTIAATSINVSHGIKLNPIGSAGFGVGEHSAVRERLRLWINIVLVAARFVSESRCNYDRVKTSHRGRESLIHSEEAFKNTSIGADMTSSLYPRTESTEDSHIYIFAVRGECDTIRLHKLVGDNSDLPGERIKAVYLRW